MRVVSENNIKFSFYLLFKLWLDKIYESFFKWKFIYYFEILISVVKYECINIDCYEFVFNNLLEFIIMKYSVFVL